ncbi:class I SAM-dependent methyltransferase [Mucilaginibacter glaciei]|uniref:Class I SAM-dependent methyltransferase n=1 Tax=Mucilaginibacter glaciei TaxID=2772109 RepID=A0A926NUK6_9SPHI|nr:class I SAM-dependent methyltransferase [Mucilaginibacter glaciei]MBD1395267.1 class I SAM-dependent methyltransferase [Mucilaginibacter glaciei]
MERENCRICDHKLIPGLVFREMMFGMRDEFGYGECPNCGSIQILTVPHHIDKYYPEYYVSFTQTIPELKRQPFFKRLFKNARVKRKYQTSNSATLSLLKPIMALPTQKILDIGCGRGELICKLFNKGFENVTGVDKFISQPIDYGYRVEVLKKELSELPANSYDILIMHHVLEHVDDQLDQLRECYRLLKKGGKIVIAIPLLGEAWDLYQRNWVQLDAPRHFVLHTLKSMDILAKKSNFTINEVVFDSTAFQFLGSELYRQDIPLTLPDTHTWYPFEQKFSPEQIADYETRAKALNAAQRGDAARFYLYKD